MSSLATFVRKHSHPTGVTAVEIWSNTSSPPVFRGKNLRLWSNGLINHFMIMTSVALISATT